MMALLVLWTAFQSLQDIEFVHEKYPVYFGHFHLQ